MSIFDDIAAEQQDPYSGINAPAPTAAISLLEKKQATLAEAQLNKTARLNPQELIDKFDSLANSGQSGYLSNLVTSSGSSILQSGGRIYDAVGSLANSQLGTNFDTDPNTGLSNQNVSNAIAGYSDAAQQDYNKRIDQFQTDTGKASGVKDYLSLMGRGIALGPEVLASSAGTLAEAVIPTVLGGPFTWLAGGALKLVGGTKLLSGALATVSKIKKIRTAIGDTSKVAGKASDAAIAGAKFITRSAKQTSLMTIDVTEMMRQDYIKKNGKEPPLEWYGNIPVTMALNSFELGIFGRFMPKMSKPLMKDMSDAIKIMSPSHRLKAAKRIINNVADMFATAGAEAAQEYLQTWHQILANSVKTDDLDTIIKTALSEIRNKSNQVNATSSALLGFGAGGAAKAISVAPKVSVGITADITKGFLKTAGKAIHKKSVQTSYRTLSSEDKVTIESDYNTNRVVADKKIDDLKAKAEVVKNATTPDDLKADSEIKKIVNKIQSRLGMTDTDLENPSSFKKLKNYVVSAYQNDQSLIRNKLKESNVAIAVSKVGKDIGSRSIEKAKSLLKTITKPEVIQAISEYGKQAVQAVSDLKSDTAIGIVEMGLRKSGNAARVAYEAAKGLDLNEIKLVATAIVKKNPKLAKRLKNLYDSKVKAKEFFGQKSSNIVTQDNLHPAITDLAANKDSINSDNAGAIISSLKNAINSQIGDVETLNIVKQALKNYESSDVFTSQKEGDGVISPEDLKIYKTKISEATDRLSTASSSEEVPSTPTKKGNVSTDKGTKVLTKQSKKTFEAVNTLLANPKNDALPDVSVQQLYDILTNEGYNTQEDFASLIEQFPNIGTSPVFYKQLSRMFDTGNITVDPVDIMATEVINDDTIIEAYKVRNPGCPV